MLDYGGGNDALCAQLRAADFRSPCPTIHSSRTSPHRRAVNSTSSPASQTLEHMPDPGAGIGAIVAHLDELGLVLFSTMPHPADFDRLGINWWYVGPRNGHISLLSRSALAKAWGRHDFRTGSFDDNMHVAFRTLPDFARHLAK